MQAQWLIIPTSLTPLTSPPGAAFVWAEEFATSHTDPNPTPDPTTDGGGDGGASAPPLVSEPSIEIEGARYAGAEQYFQLQKSKTTPEYRQAAVALASGELGLRLRSPGFGCFDGRTPLVNDLTF